MPLKIGRGDIGHIHEHALETYPEECAGIMVGMDAGIVKVVVDVWRADNIHEEERSRRFLIDPRVYMDLEEKAGERDLDIIGIYHSHPDHPAEPSEYDREHALPGWSYVIVSAGQDEVKDLRCWVLKADRSGYDEEQVVS